MVVFFYKNVYHIFIENIYILLYNLCKYIIYGGVKMKKLIRLLADAKKYWKYIFLGSFGLILTTSMQLISPQIIRRLLSLIETKSPLLGKYSLYLSVFLIFIYVFQWVGQFMRSYFMHYAAHHYIAELRPKLFRKLVSLSMRYYHDKQTGQLMSRIISDTSVLEVLVAHALPDLVVNIVMFVSVATILIATNVKLGLISLSLMPFVLVAVWYYATKVRPIFKKSHQTTAELSAVLQDDISGMKEIQLFNQQKREEERVKAYSSAHCTTIMSALSKGAVYHPSIEFLNNLCTAIVIGFGGYMAFKGEANASEIVAFILYLTRLYQPISTLGRLNEDYQNAMAATERIFELLDEESDVNDAPDAYDMPKAEGKIEFKDVSFKYNQTGDVLKNVSVTVNPGETLALVGPTGVGKTTFISLVSRFYDPTSGKIMLDGHDLTKITQKSLRDNMSVVLQDVFLFNGTVEENIRYGCESATDEEVMMAARIANAHEFIEKMENGYKTIIGERGVRLSGGQKQRISIARAVLRNSPVLILDEATASVDTQTEKLIQQAIDELVKNRTTIIIAHRLSTVRNADKIAVLEDGMIKEIGKHEELIKKGGLYANLCKIQFNTEA